LSKNEYASALLIVNPVSGTARGLRLGNQLRSSLERSDIACTVRVTNGAGDAQQWSCAAATDGFDLIVVIGGDGTVNEAVSGQARTGAKVPVAIVPVGTANVVSLALALPWFPGLLKTSVIKTSIVEGRVLAFDVGYIPAADRHFLLMAALGYPARVIQDSPRRLKNLFGIFTYVASGVRNALNLDEVRIRIADEDSQVHYCEGNTILLSNIGKIGDINLKVTPDTSAHDGLFDITVISSRSLWDLIAVIFRMLTWRYRPTSRLEHFQASQVSIVTDPPVAVQIDGESLGMSPLAAEIVADGVHLIVGSRYH